MKKNRLLKLWGGPALVGVITTIGLLSALIGDGAWDWLSAVLLAVPVAMCVFYSSPRGGSGS